jgi:hypothetical protein
MEHTHNYYTIKDLPDGKLEICIECKKRLTTKKDPKTGRIDNKKYLKEHIRDTAQPFGKTGKIFAKNYGEEAGYISKFK